MRRFAGLLPFLVAGPAPCQEPPGAAWEELVGRLADSAARDFAIAEMDAFGAEAVARLIRDVDPDSPRQARELLYAISELAHHAGSEIPALTGLLDECSPELRVDVVETLFRVSAFLPSVAGGRTSRAALAVARAGMKTAEGELQQRFAVVYWRFLQLDLDEPLGVDSATDTLVAALRPAPHLRRHRQTRAETAAKILGRRGAEARGAVPALLAWVRDPVPPHTQVTSWRGREVRYDGALPSSRWFAVAVTRIVPGTADALEAHGYLARHGNSREFQRAVEAIRLHAEHASAAVPHLIAVLREADATARPLAQQREVVTTLGTLGEVARSAAPVLRELLRREDGALAPLARAALRSLEHR